MNGDPMGRTFTHRMLSIRKDGSGVVFMIDDRGNLAKCKEANRRQLKTMDPGVRIPLLEPKNRAVRKRKRRVDR